MDMKIVMKNIIYNKLNNKLNKTKSNNDVTHRKGWGWGGGGAWMGEGLRKVYILCRKSPSIIYIFYCR